MLGLTLVETHCPSVAFAVTLILQAAPWADRAPEVTTEVALALNFLDLAGLDLWQWVLRPASWHVKRSFEAFMLVISSGWAE